MSDFTAPNATKTTLHHAATIANKSSAQVGRQALMLFDQQCFFAFISRKYRAMNFQLQAYIVNKYNKR